MMIHVIKMYMYKPSPYHSISLSCFIFKNSQWGYGWGAIPTAPTGSASAGIFREIVMFINRCFFTLR